MNSEIYLKNNTKSVTIVNGELTSFKNESYEFMHQKGNKGWRNTDNEMFPKIRRMAKTNFRMQTKKGEAIQDQHGLLRELKYALISSDENTANFTKKYVANTRINNSKFPKKSTEEELFWSYNFSFEKNFRLEKDLLKIEFNIHAEEGMPFMLGYHPAFLLSGSGKETLAFRSKEINLNHVLEAGANAFPILNTNCIVLKNSDKNDLQITTKGFDNFMLWTEVNNMLCIEPITQYMSSKTQQFLEENMRLSQGENSFSVEIKIL